MIGKKAKNPGGKQPEDRFGQALRRELMRWYCGALYRGKIQSRKSPEPTRCATKKV